MKLHYYCNAKKGICNKSNCNHCKIFDKTGGRYIEVDENRKPTNFEVITQNEESFIEWVLDNYYSVPEKLPCTKSCNGDCKECFKEWLQKECE